MITYTAFKHNMHLSRVLCYKSKYIPSDKQLLSLFTGKDQLYISYCIQQGKQYIKLYARDTEQKSRQSIVTGFRKMCIVYTSNFAHLEIIKTTDNGLKI